MPSDFHRALAQERRKDALSRCMAEQDLERARGVCWSGYSPPPHPAPRSDRDLRTAAMAQCAALRDWRASDVGRLSAAVGLARRAAEQANLAADAAGAALSRGGDTLTLRCHEAADALEARGRDLIAAAQAARSALAPLSA
jgi:hypothetical protein